MQEAYDMTWREYQLRRLGFVRSQKREWEKTRTIAYYSLVATGAISTKKMSIEKFMPLEGKKANKVSDTAKEAFRKAQENYIKETNGSRT